MSKKNTGWMPLWIRVEGARSLVVGGGQVALRKTRMLLEAGATVEVVTKKACPEVQEMAQKAMIELKIKEVEKEDLRGARLVIVATDKGEVNRCVSEWAQEMQLLCNVVDKPELCTAIFPAILRKGSLEVAVSTGGSSPAMAARIRDHIGDLLLPGYELLLKLLGEIRARVKKMSLADEKRVQVLRALVDEEVMEACKKENESELRDLLEMRLKRALQEDSESKKNRPWGFWEAGPETGDKSL